MYLQHRLDLFYQKNLTLEIGFYPVIQVVIRSFSEWLGRIAESPIKHPCFFLHLLAKSKPYFTPLLPAGRRSVKCRGAASGGSAFSPVFYFFLLVGGG